MPGLGSAATGCPDGEACIVVSIEGPTPSTQYVTLQNLADWNDGGTYTTTVVNARGQKVPSDNIDSPVFLSTIIDHLDNVPLSAVKQVYFDVPAPSTGTSTPLGPDELGPGTYQDGQQPVVGAVGNSITYYRPMRSGDPSDRNGVVDYWQSSPGRPVHLTISTEKLLDLNPTISASPASARKNQRVTFSLSYPDSPDTRGFTYQWTFRQGTLPATGPSPTQVWSVCGGFPVSVVIKAPDGAAGRAALKDAYEVGGCSSTSNPTPTTSDHPHGGTSKPNSPLTGPDQGTGTHTDQNARPGKTPKGHPHKPVPGIQPVALTTVTGTVLLGANGQPVPSTADSPPQQSVDLPVAARRSTSKVGRTHLGWAWSLLALVPLAAGAALELRPRRKQA